MENSRTVILLSVNVPVLSEHIAETEPNVSTEGSRFTMALWLAKTRVPSEYSVVTTTGIPVGMAQSPKLLRHEKRLKCLALT